MRYIYFFIGLINWIIFAYDIEYDRDFMTWMWLLVSIYFFVNSYVVYKQDKKYNYTHLSSIECPGCKDATEKEKMKCAGCGGKGCRTFDK